MSQQQREPAEAYFPHYVEDDAELDYCYERCNCDWESMVFEHPSQSRYHGDLHSEYGRTPDCSLTETVLIFKDGSGATI